MKIIIEFEPDSQPPTITIEGDNTSKQYPEALAAATFIKQILPEILEGL
ncbi:TPA: hypothetical protein ACX6RM_001292 [Photobacterium damselae]